jgi:light-regulated signal transduction histidine kinase (bacteriophytochrome)
MEIRKPKQFFLILLAACSTIIVFIADILTPLGYAAWLFYTLPILITYLTNSARVTYLFLFVGAIALFIGFNYSPIHTVYENYRYISFFNRSTGLLVLVVFTVIITKLMQVSKHYKSLSNELVLLNKELESFSFSAAHDLKAPLIAMNGFGNILVENYSDALDNQGRDYLKRIVAGSDRMTSIIDDMLILSKISLQEIKVQDVNISEIATSIIEEMKAVSPERKVDVHIHPGLKCRADSHLIRIALTNLLANAWKYTSKNETTEIEIGFTTSKGEGTFYVKDNGSGFDMKNADKLFEPFKRLHTEKEFPGTGIGLSIVDRIIRRHNGCIWGKGEIGKGATFYFSLPK